MVELEPLTINARQVDAYVDSSDVLVVDIREKSEFLKYHIKNATNIPQDMISEKLYVLDKYRMIILYCDRGGNSLMLAKQLRNKNYNARSLVGGIVLYRESH